MDSSSASATSSAPLAAAANASIHGVPPTLVWANTVIATAGALCGIVALALVILRLDDYTHQIALEKRLQTQAIDELRVEANVSRRLAGLPTVDSHEHGETK